MGLYPRDWGGRVSLALDAYYDESGSHDGSHLNVLAGFAARPQQWEAFEREWMKILRKHRITHVRAKHLFHRQRQHKGWKDKQITELWADLMYVIQEREMFASKTYLFEEDYKLFYVSDGQARRERLDSRYALCFRSLLHNLPAVYRTFHLDGDINFVLYPPAETLTHAHMLRVRARLPYPIGPPDVSAMAVSVGARAA